jgi:capsular exopolysaccharide synthesis family protein
MTLALPAGPTAHDPPPYWAPAAERETGVLGDLLRALRRQVWLALAVALLAFGVATALLLALTPTYRAASTVLLEARRVAPVARDEASADPPLTTELVADMLQVLQSRGLLQQVVERLGLIEDPEFNWTLKPSRAMAAADRVEELAGPAVAAPLRSVLERLTGRGEVPEGSLPMDITIDSVQRSLLVAPLGRSRAIQITATTTSPQTSAAIANTLAETYIANQAGQREAELRAVGEWVATQLSALRSRADASARAVVAFRTAQGLVRGISRSDLSANLVQQEISEVASQLTAARSRRAQLAARLRDAEASLASGNIDALAAVLDSRTVQAMRTQEAVIGARMAEASARYGRAHPSYVAVASELADIRRTIGRESDRILRSAQNDLRVAEENQRELEVRLDALRGDIGRSEAVEVRLQELQREADADRALAESFLARARQISAEADFRDPNARLVSRAAVPRKPFSPNLALLLPLAFVASLGVGGAAGIAREVSRRGLRSLDEMAATFGLLPLGVVPLHRGPSDRIGRALFREAIAGFTAHLLRAGPDGARPRSVLVTSALPNEGKSTMAAALAADAAQRGLNVVLVEADLRRGPREAAAPGLSDLLQGRGDAEAVLRRDPTRGYWLLPSGKRPDNPTQLLTSPLMERLLRQLAARSDLVIIDTAPVLVGGDVPVLARVADQTMLLVRWDRTPADDVAAALRRLVVGGAQVAGAVMTMVDVRRSAPYSDSGHALPRLQRSYGAGR